MDSLSPACSGLEGAALSAANLGPRYVHPSRLQRETRCLILPCCFVPSLPKQRLRKAAKIALQRSPKVPLKGIECVLHDVCVWKNCQSVSETRWHEYRKQAQWQNALYVLLRDRMRCALGIVVFCPNETTYTEKKERGKEKKRRLSRSYSLATL